MPPGLDARGTLHPTMKWCGGGTVVSLQARKREEIAASSSSLPSCPSERGGRKASQKGGEREKERDLCCPEDIQRDNALRDASGNSEADRSSPSFSAPSFHPGLWRFFALPSRFFPSPSSCFLLTASFSSSPAPRPSPFAIYMNFC